jgi:hypothetical protein
VLGIDILSTEESTPDPGYRTPGRVSATHGNFPASASQPTSRYSELNRAALP